MIFFNLWTYIIRSICCHVIIHMKVLVSWEEALLVWLHISFQMLCFCFHLVKKILTFWRLLRTFLSVRTFLFGMLFFSTPGWLHMLVEWNDLLIQNQCDHSIHSWAIIAVFWCLLYTTFSCCNTWTRVGLFRNV